MRLAMLLLAAAAASTTLATEPVAAALEAGHAAMRSRDYVAAAASFEKATQLRPDGAEGWFGLGLARARLEQREAAIEAYRRSIELDPQNPKAHLNLGNVYFRLGNMELSEKAYALALELDPNYLLAAFHHGWVLRQLNRSEEAERVFTRCMEIPADGRRGQKAHADCLFGLASLRHRQGDYATSAGMMEQVVGVFPQHAEAHYYLGMAYRQLGRLDQAKEQFALHEQLVRHMDKALIESPIDP